MGKIVEIKYRHVLKRQRRHNTTLFLKVRVTTKQTKKKGKRFQSYDMSEKKIYKKNFKVKKISKQLMGKSQPIR